VNEYAPHSKTGTKLAFTLGWATNDAFDGDGNLLVADQQGPPIAIDVFPPGASEPSQQITQGLVDPVYLAFSKQRNRLFVADPGASAVLVYDYPSGTLVETLNNGLTSVYGVAVSPEGL
jgi:DNA-binding beta-propeller fold protein YncE